MRNEILMKLNEWSSIIDEIQGGRRDFYSTVDALGLPIVLDSYDSTVYDDVDDYIKEMSSKDDDYKSIKLNDIPVVQLERYYNDYSNGKRLNHFIIYPKQEYVKEYIRQRKIERIKKLSSELN